MKENSSTFKTDNSRHRRQFLSAPDASPSDFSTHPRHSMCLCLSSSSQIMNSSSLLSSTLSSPVKSFIFQVFITTLVMASIFPIVCNAAKSDACEYDLDLTANRVKIICEGSPSMVNIYADRALLQADEYNKARTEAEEYNQRVTPGSQRETPEMMNREHDSRPSSGTDERSTNSGPMRPQSLRQPDDVQKDRYEMKTNYHASAFEYFVLNATEKLEKAKRSLSTYADSIKNISTQLREGDLILRSDMEKLRRTRYSATGATVSTDLKEGIIAAMTNQYNFMRSALLTLNIEMERVVTSLKWWSTSPPTDSITLYMRTVLLWTRLQTLMTPYTEYVKWCSKELKRKDGKKHNKNRKGMKAKIRDECPKEISAIGTGTYKDVDWPVGAYLVESVNPSEYRTVYIMKGSGPSMELSGYDAAIDVDYDLVGRYYHLPFFCSGTGHAVYRRHFYCHKADSNMVIKYHLKRMDIVSDMILPGAGYGNKYPYSSGENTDVDLAVDEYGLWAIYATEDSAGKIVITKIDHQKMEVEKTWMTSYPKHHIGNAFMICGKLYATNSHKDTPTFIRYVYDTNTNKGQVLQPGDIPFPNSALLGMTDVQGAGQAKNSSNTVSLNYDFRTSKLYAWNNGRIEAYPVYFKDEP